MPDGFVRKTELNSQLRSVDRETHQGVPPWTLTVGLVDELCAGNQSTHAMATVGWCRRRVGQIGLAEIPRVRKSRVRCQYSGAYLSCLGSVRAAVIGAKID
ncbi:MAG: hypothetical protein J07HR59_00397 [Halorubrum sp. J07HR59]|nr:MAG: hypothetical protein J07HR59_00397 [Halorubrum sp. J07HR59]